MVKRFICWIVIIPFGVAAGCASGDPEQEESKQGQEVAYPEHHNWETFRSEEYAFQLRIPPDWSRHESRKLMGRPLFNFYTDKPADVALPLDHHTPAVLSQVTVLPGGGAWDGPSGDRRPSDGKFGLGPPFDLENSRTFVLEDGTPWAGYFHLRDHPPSWEKAGHIWAAVPIENLEVECLRDGSPVSMDRCDPMMGDRLIRRGQVEAPAWDTLLEILRSFEFLASSGDLARRELKDLIRVEIPQPGQKVESPLQVRGRARGNWYFEGDFPVRLEDAEGRTLDEVPAQAQDEWMTEDWVPFAARLSFSSSETDEGVLILQRSNASGLPEHDRELRIPVRFAR